MSWKYYRNGKLVDECNDLPETMEDAVIELQENGHDVSDCVVEETLCDDFWAPDYPPEEVIPRKDWTSKLTFEPVSDEEVEQWEEDYVALVMTGKALKTSDDFIEMLNKRIIKEHKISLYQRFKQWCKKWYIKIFR